MEAGLLIELLSFYLLNQGSWLKLWASVAVSWLVSSRLHWIQHRTKQPPSIARQQVSLHIWPIRRAPLVTCSCGYRGYPLKANNRPISMNRNLSALLDSYFCRVGYCLVIMSRWKIPELWHWSIAWTNWRKIRLHWGSLKGVLFIRKWPHNVPQSSSVSNMKINSSPTSNPSKIFAMRLQLAVASIWRWQYSIG